MIAPLQTGSVGPSDSLKPREAQVKESPNKDHLPVLIEPALQTSARALRSYHTGSEHETSLERCAHSNLDELKNESPGAMRLTLETYRHQSRTTSKVDLLAWLSAARSSTNAQIQDKSCPASIPTSKNERKPPSPPSPSVSSSLLSAFVDELFSEESIKTEPGTSVLSPRLRPPNFIKNSKSMVKDETKGKATAVDQSKSCDRCESQSLEFIISSKRRRACDHCNSRHLACTRNGVCVTKLPSSSGNPIKISAPIRRRNVRLGSAEDDSDWRPDQSSVNSTIRRKRRPKLAQRKLSSASRVEEHFDSNDSDIEFVRSNATKKAVQCVSLQGSHVGRSGKNEFPKQSSRNASTLSSAGLDTYTRFLLHDTKQAVQRCQSSLSNTTGLIALKPTLSLLLEGYASVSDSSSNATLHTIAQYLGRIIVECCSIHLISAETDCNKLETSLLLAQTLFDRCMSLIATLLEDNAA